MLNDFMPEILHVDSQSLQGAHLFEATVVAVLLWGASCFNGWDKARSLVASSPTKHLLPGLVKTLAKDIFFCDLLMIINLCINRISSSGRTSHDVKMIWKKRVILGSESNKNSNANTHRPPHLLNRRQTHPMTMQATRTPPWQRCSTEKHTAP